MKVLKMIQLIFFIVFLSGCATNGLEEHQEELTKEEFEIEIEVVEDRPITEIEQELEEVVEIVAIEETAVYILQSDHTVKPIDSSSHSNKVVLLTIDDAPNRYSVEMAKVLKELEVNAIFFVNGHFIKNGAGREKLKTIYDLGFEIGNHTMSHPNLSKLSSEEQRQEIVELNDLIEEIIGERPRFFRAPFGVNTDTSRAVVKEEEMQWMNWTYGYDFEKKYMEKNALIDIMVNTNLLRPGANLLMHDHPWTLEALPYIVKGLKDKGYGFVDPKQIQ